MSETDGKIVWFEVAADKGDRAREFYGSLFGWGFQRFGDEGDYQMTDGGAVYTNPDGKGIIVYFGTSDLDASIARVNELGGSAGEPHEITNTGRYTVCTDTEGNPFGLYQAG